MESNEPRKRPGRPHRLPPVPTEPNLTEEIAAFEGVAATSKDLATVLWQSLRDTLLWARIPARKRRDLFQAPTPKRFEYTVRAREAAPELTEALGTFHQLCWMPQATSRDQVAAACTQVYKWAEARSDLVMAAYFAETASLADPRNPARANEAARLCRRAALHSRASQWYERAFVLAKRIKDREQSLWALLGYGSLLYGIGLFAQAQDAYEKAARRALRTGRRREAADAHHDLLILHMDLENYARATAHALEAIELYPRRNARIPHLVHAASALLLRQHQYSEALPLLQRLPPLFPRPEERVLILGTLSHAAAGAGWPDRYHRAAQETLELAERHIEHAAAALVHVAAGARILREWEKAEQYALRAIEVARIRQDAGQERLARTLLSEIEQRKPAPGEAPASEKIAAFAYRVAARLRAWKAPDPGTDPDADGDPPAR